MPDPPLSDIGDDYYNECNACMLMLYESGAGKEDCDDVFCVTVLLLVRYEQQH